MTKKTDKEIREMKANIGKQCMVQNHPIQFLNNNIGTIVAVAENSTNDYEVKFTKDIKIKILFIPEQYCLIRDQFNIRLELFQGNLLQLTQKLVHLVSNGYTKFEIDYDNDLEESDTVLIITKE